MAQKLMKQGGDEQKRVLIQQKESFKIEEEKQPTLNSKTSDGGSSHGDSTETMDMELIEEAKVQLPEEIKARQSINMHLEQRDYRKSLKEQMESKMKNSFFDQLKAEQHDEAIEEDSEGTNSISNDSDEDGVQSSRRVRINSGKSKQSSRKRIRNELPKEDNSAEKQVSSAFLVGVQKIVEKVKFKELM